ncbi:hypothetical protein EGI15_15350 [Chryseobacterium cucumeris]|uniref:Uncharacterized protein n=1 Tax=Chryseobacterium cucumeris TaxID=1813611 RepID=A0ABX9X2L5_9FLAO|nr:hypothetical protein EGI15_15350 [Chryseobacterium cucumeris]
MHDRHFIQKWQKSRSYTIESRKKYVIKNKINDKRKPDLKRPILSDVIVENFLSASRLFHNNFRLIKDYG